MIAAPRTAAISSHVKAIIAAYLAPLVYLSPCIVEAIANGTAPRYNHAERFSVIGTR
jgi:hypothetical protein